MVRRGPSVRPSRYSKTLNSHGGVAIFVGGRGPGGGVGGPGGGFDWSRSSGKPLPVVAINFIRVVLVLLKIPFQARLIRLEASVLTMTMTDQVRRRLVPSCLLTFCSSRSHTTYLGL